MTTTTKHDAKAEYLLEKGLKVMWSKGYNGTSVNDIVKEAEVPKGSFYFYFKSKEDFAVKALKNYFQTIVLPGTEILDNKELAPLVRLNQFFELKKQFIEDEFNCSGCMACNVTAEMGEHSEAIREVVIANENFFFGKVAGVMREAQEQGDFAPDVDVEATTNFIRDAWKGAMLSAKMMQNPSPLLNALNFTKKLLN